MWTHYGSGRDARTVKLYGNRSHLRGRRYLGDMLLHKGALSGVGWNILPRGEKGKGVLDMKQNLGSERSMVRYIKGHKESDAGG